MMNSDSCAIYVKHEKSTRKKTFLFKNNISIIIDSKLTLIYRILNIFFLLIFMCEHKKKIQLEPRE